jgi:hypothetical protein
MKQYSRREHIKAMFSPEGAQAYLAGISIVLEAELEAFDTSDVPTAPELELSMADHFALHALGIDWDHLDTRD